ncbi:hypothetical protein G7K_1847-t2 [Saitoella complicata NRRL Y-17804]|uniref:Oxysterol-binding protein n=1 Tax=Saitoella complicata (strain BCRC 22490 / CBS 7301 / JCM 7358 / NBRC 10748 / NRRL Y-17804) TaxID=698492 RepID=A0A0E9NCQ5_SAICN|nr:hypothetical protein G7K_1847-t2 [Saitoella complicata NRRL Y-17804]
MQTSHTLGSNNRQNTKDHTVQLLQWPTTKRQTRFPPLRRAAGLYALPSRAYSARPLRRLYSFLKSIMTFSGDLSSMTAPSFILSSTSLIEYCSYWGEHPDLFAQIAKETDVEKRCLAVLRWYISTLKGMFAARNENLGSEKKPFNPILGEQFKGEWNTGGDVGTTKLVAEQVSHHPPVFAYRMYNPTHKISFEGYGQQKTGFSGRTMTVKQLGHAMLHLTLPDGTEEHYLVTLPGLILEGLLMGSPYVELTGTSYIVGSNGYVSAIDYSGKGWISGKKNSLKATLTAPGQKKPSYTVSGSWSKQSTLRNESNKVEQPFWDATSPTRHPISVPEPTASGPYESRRVWQSVAAALNAGDFDAAAREKSKLEQAQRDKRKQEAEQGKGWEQAFFNWDPRDGWYEQLLNLLGKDAKGMPAQEGFWKWKPEAFEQ